MYTGSMFFKHYTKAALLGVAVAAAFFLLLVVAGYDQPAVETVLGMIVFMAYTQTRLYHKEHGKGPKQVFYSFLAFLGGLSVGYLVLWIFLLIALSLFSDPSLSI
jgi:uncharacterized membrane protein